MAPAATPGAPTRGRAVVRPSRRDAAAEVVPREEGSPGAAAARAARAEARRGASARATDEAAHAITVLPVRVGRSVALRSLVRSPRRAARLCGRRNDLTRLVESPPGGATRLPTSEIRQSGQCSGRYFNHHRLSSGARRAPASFSRPPLAAARLHLLPRPPLALDDVDGRARRRGRADRPSPGRRGQAPEHPPRRARDRGHERGGGARLPRVPGRVHPDGTPRAPRRQTTDPSARAAPSRPPPVTRDARAPTGHNPLPRARASAKKQTRPRSPAPLPFLPFPFRSRTGSRTIT